MTGLAARIGRATATTMLAGAVGGVAVLVGEAIAAKGRRYAKPTMGLALRTSMGPSSAPVLRLVLLGDAAAIGVGVEWLSETVGGQLARMLAEGSPQTGERHVLLSSVGVAGSRPSIEGAATSGGLLALDPGAWGPSDVTLRTVWTRDGVPIDGAVGGSYSPTAADVGHSISAVVTGSRVGAPSLTLTSAAVLITEPMPETPVTPDRRARWAV